jgi:hypothetical protein
MTGPSNPSTPPFTNPPQAPSPDAAGTSHLTPAQAKAYIDHHYRRQEIAGVLNLLQNYLGFRIEKPRDLSRVLDFLEAFKKLQFQLRTLKNRDMRKAGLSNRRRKAKEPCGPASLTPKLEATVIALWRWWCKEIGEPLPMEDRLEWAREQLKDEANLSETIRSGLDLE